jgi:hypothetical protein
MGIMYCKKTKEQENESVANGCSKFRSHLIPFGAYS